MRRVTGLLVAAMVVGACSGADEAAGPRGTLPLADTPATSPTENTGPASDLAPSQLTASTVAAPTTPGPCDVGQLEFWTSQVAPADETADATIRIRNGGAEWCEPDIGASPLIDPAIEPDVWLDPGGWADLIVVGEPGCGESVSVTAVPIVLDGVAIEIGSAVIASCGWKLSAFYPAEVAEQPCDDLETVVVDGFLLVRNASFVSCQLGALVSITGDGLSTEPAAERDGPSVVDLAGGDVLAFPYRVEGESVCGPERSAIAEFGAAGPIEIAGTRCGAVHETGPGRPYFGEIDGPLAAHRGGPLDVEAALAALDPFAVGG